MNEKMLPDFLFTVNQSMQGIPRDDNFSPLSSEKDMCGGVNRASTENGSSNNNNNNNQQQQPIFSLALKRNVSPSSSSRDDHLPLRDGLHLPADIVKLDGGQSSVDLFPTHPTTWHQHPMNNPEHAHLRLRPSSPQVNQQQQQNQQHRHHHHRYHPEHEHSHGGINNDQHQRHRYAECITSKLLLQGSEDPLISCGATDDDEHPLELKSLIDAAVVNERQSETPTESISRKRIQASTVSQKRHQNDNGGNNSTCSLLTKQQLKMKAAGLICTQNQQQLATEGSNVPAQLSTNAITTMPTTTIKLVRTPKPKKKNGVLKLRFHHQALPAEYLNHYEATQSQQAARAAAQQQQRQQLQQLSVTANAGHEVQPPKKAHTARLPPPKTPHENVRSWLQKIAEIQRTAELQQQQKQQHQQLQQQQQEQQPHAKHSDIAPPAIPLNNINGHFDDNNNSYKIDEKNSSALELCPSISKRSFADIIPQSPSLISVATNLPQDSSRKRVVKYSDLPYMGEITLDNSKPRRGRKPKKTDICHLIYKNYGTIFPGTPRNVLTAPSPADASLAGALKGQHHHQQEPQLAELQQLDQPLNLCLRDHQMSSTTDLCSLSSCEDDYGPTSESSSTTATSPLMTPVTTTPSDLINDSVLAANLSRSMETAPLHSLPVNNSNYYRQLIEASGLLQPNGRLFGLPVETIEKDNQIALKIQLPSGLLLTPPKQEKPSSIVHHLSTEYPEPMSTPSSIKSENSMGGGTITALVAPKRKRSAIFVPPKPAETSAANSTATEVSICKFKFTGGDNPCLQEKKMLSVDSDGTYRYFNGSSSGSGIDKMPLRCELFIRDHHQVVPNAIASSRGVNGGMDVPPPSAGLSNEMLQLSESPPSTLLLPQQQHHTAILPESPSSSSYAATTLAPVTVHLSNHYPTTATNGQDENGSPGTKGTSSALTFHHQLSKHSLRRSPEERSERKKKSRRSSQREKLEKTFKEKGFLIQTQQLESAEGATYCKFRQLKKFTRYLFRNWKDYLPEDLHHAKVAAAAAAAAAAANTDNSIAGMNSTDSAVAIETLLANHTVPEDVMTSGRCKELTFIEVTSPVGRNPSETSFNLRGRGDKL